MYSFHIAEINNYQNNANEEDIDIIFEQPNDDLFRVYLLLFADWITIH